MLLLVTGFAIVRQFAHVCAQELRTLRTKNGTQETRELLRMPRRRYRLPAYENSRSSQTIHQTMADVAAANNAT